jgi:hypothetical protein
MAILINDYTITEFVDFEAYHRSTGLLDFKLEEMQNFTLNATQDKNPLTGKNGRIIGYKKANKAISGEGTYGLISAGLMKAQTGGTITASDSLSVKKSEVKVVSGATVTTDATATGTAGAEIGEIKVLADNGAVATTYAQAVSADATHFSYNPSTKTITLPVDSDTGVIANGKKIVYSYTRTVSGTKVTDPSDTFSEVREVWIHAFGTDSCDNEYFIAIHIPRADFSGEFSIELGGDQTVHNFSFDAMADLCAASSGISSDLFDVIIYTSSSNE